MKTLIASALVATAALTALPAAAQQVAPGAAAAIAHFNESADGNSDRTVLSAADLDDGVTVSTRTGVPGTAYDVFNQSADGAGDVTGVAGATSYAGQPAFGGDIFDALRAESQEDE